MTGFEPIELEKNVRQFWKKENVKERVRETTEGNKRFFMIDGPPYLNGEPHVGHMQGKVLKDVMLRFKQMQGHDVWDQAGFDTHGLPNELATEEELGIESKNEIGDSISAAEFIKRCRERATSAGETWRTVMNELAIWQDFENPYMTYDNDYIETAWWLLNKVEDQDLLYEGRKPIHWCPRCQTSLSGYEVTDEYRTVDDIAVYAKFPLEDRDEKLVIWTTTPWTIPSNMAVFVHPDYVYAIVDTGKEKLVIAEQLVENVMAKAGIEDYDIERTMSGSDLKSLKYTTPFENEIPRQKEMEDEDDQVHRVFTSEELVTLEDGTGLVHAATGHGPEDYEETRRFDLEVFSPVDSEGFYTEEAGELEGENVNEVDPRIESMLDEKGLLLHSEKHRHEYPHCWRCKTSLIYRAADQWFIKNERVKQRMLEENEEVDWVPESARKRFHNFAKESPDWCISRQNYWGIPIPVWVCNECDEYETVGSFEQLEEKVGELPEEFDPHKHVVDDMTWSCECGGEMERIPDIFDVWFDSGIAPFASLHYPFEEQPFENLWPMDFITEASDQIRGWFYHLLFAGILGFDEKPFEKILFQGYVLRPDGEKMSKSAGTTIDPQTQVDKYGADLPRFYQLRLAPPWEQKNYDENEIQNEIYRLFNVYWNTKEFYLDHGEEVEQPDNLEIEDRWILSRINSINAMAPEKMENCHFHQLTRALEEFIVKDLSRWYVKKIRRRIKDGDQAANWTLKQVLDKLTLLMAPFTPHITERVYEDLDGEEFSVHAESYPEADEHRISEDLEEGMEIAREIVEKSGKLRDENQYNLRWPAKRLVISTKEETKEKLGDFEQLITNMANVKKIEFGDVASEPLGSPDYSKLGPKFGADAEKVADLIDELDPDQLRELENNGELELENYQIEAEDVEITSRTKGEVSAKTFTKGEIFLDLEMDSEIEDEAFVSEIIRAIQQKRKEADLDVEDRVNLSFEGDTEAIENSEEQIRNRVNVEEISFNRTDYKHSEDVKFQGRKIKFAFSAPIG